MFVAYKKGTYPNLPQSLIVTVDVLLSHDAKLNILMWAWQLCDVVLVNKSTVVTCQVRLWETPPSSSLYYSVSLDTLQSV